MRFAGARFTISGSMPINHRKVQMRQSNSSRQARRYQLEFRHRSWAALPHRQAHLRRRLRPRQLQLQPPPQQLQPPQRLLPPRQRQLLRHQLPARLKRQHRRRLRQPRHDLLLQSGRARRYGLVRLLHLGRSDKKLARNYLQVETAVLFPLGRLNRRKNLQNPLRL